MSDHAKTDDHPRPSVIHGVASSDKRPGTFGSDRRVELALSALAYEARKTAA